MNALARSDVTTALGEMDDVVVTEILDIGATPEELAEAQAWLTNDEAMMNSGRPLPAGRVGRLVEVLTRVMEDEPGPAGHRI